MQLQKAILNQYLDLSGNPTLKNIAEETGIQLTRVFRLLNGSAMKISEYQVFSDLVQKKLGLEDSLTEYAEQCMLKISKEGIQELEQLLKRKLEIWELKQCGQKKIVEKKLG